MPASPIASMTDMLAAPCSVCSTPSRLVTQTEQRAHQIFGFAIGLERYSRSQRAEIEHCARFVALCGLHLPGAIALMVIPAPPTV